LTKMKAILLSDKNDEVKYDSLLELLKWIKNGQ
jgi:hypothetical protein